MTEPALAMPPECHCVTCALCQGRGSYYVDSRGHVAAFNDGLFDLESCEDCGGTGIIRECDTCREAWEQDHDEDGL